MLSVDEYQRLCELAQKAGMSTKRIPKPRCLSLKRPDVRKIAELLMTNDRIVITRHPNKLVIMSWTNYEAVKNNCVKARASIKRFPAPATNGGTT